MIDGSVTVQTMGQHSVQEDQKPLQIMTRAGVLLRLLVAAAEGDLGEEASKDGLTTVDAATRIGISRTHASHALNQLHDVELVNPTYDHATSRIFWKVTEKGVQEFFGPIN